MLSPSFLHGQLLMKAQGMGLGGKASRRSREAYQGCPSLRLLHTMALHL